MAEISAKDLRRLRALEGRLEKADAQRKERAGELRRVRRELAALEREAERQQRSVDEYEKQISALVEENRSMAGRLEEIQADVNRVETAAQEVARTEQAARQELDEATAARAESERQVASISADRDRLASRLKLAEGQLSSKDEEPFVPPEDVGTLVRDLVEGVSGRLQGLDVRDGEVKLRVAFGRTADATGFVLPTVDSGPEVRENLHEVSFRFDRRAEPS